MFLSFVIYIINTGASSGIGAATAQLFSRFGASLALTGRNTKNLEDVAQKCSGDKTHEVPLTIQGNETFGSTVFLGWKIII